jgi:hypothetical protein
MDQCWRERARACVRVCVCVCRQRPLILSKARGRVFGCTVKTLKEETTQLFLQSGETEVKPFTRNGSFKYVLCK